MPIAAGQRPSQRGYSSAWADSPRARPPATADTPRATARHGLNSAKTSPSSAEANGMPTQKT